MKAVSILLFAFALYSNAGFGQEQNSQEQEFQMQKQHALFLVHFETGSAWNSSLAANEQTNFAEHSANLNRLRKKGVIRFGARYAEYGMIILGAESLAAATALMEDDPGVQAKIFTFRIDPLNVFYPWKVEQ